MRLCDSTVIEFRHKDIQVDAIGRGGIETCYILPQFQLAFDTGRAPDNLIDIPRIFLTHGHLDHAAGLPYYISQRSLKHLPPPDIYCPAEITEPLSEILRLWQKIEGFSYEIKLNGLNVGDTVEIRKDLSVKALQSHHRVPCRGYAVMRKTRKLKDEFLHLPGREIKLMKDRGDKIFEDRDHPVFAFSGDTTIEFLRDNERRLRKVAGLQSAFLRILNDPQSALTEGELEPLRCLGLIIEDDADGSVRLRYPLLRRLQRGRT